VQTENEMKCNWQQGGEIGTEGWVKKKKERKEKRHRDIEARPCVSL